MTSTVLTISPIFCINLDIYPERWIRTKTEIKRTFGYRKIGNQLTALLISYFFSPKMGQREKQSAGISLILIILPEFP